MSCCVIPGMQGSNGVLCTMIVISGLEYVACIMSVGGL